MDPIIKVGVVFICFILFIAGAVSYHIYHIKQVCKEGFNAYYDYYIHSGIINHPTVNMSEYAYEADCK
jgi:cell division protein FtsW (lipid II flippase)